jgi:probable addiction module antidote protein
MVKISNWDSSEVLDSEEAISHYLAAAWEDSTTEHKIRALANVAKARNMTTLADKMGVSRSSLYKTLSGSVSPSFATVEKLLSALNVKMTFVPCNTRLKSSSKRGTA